MGLVRDWSDFPWGGITTHFYPQSGRAQAASQQHPRRANPNCANARRSVPTRTEPTRGVPKLMSRKNGRLPTVDGKKFATAIITAFVRRAHYMMWRTRAKQPRSPNAQCCRDARPTFALRNFRCSHALLPQRCSGLSTLRTRGQATTSREAWHANTCAVCCELSSVNSPPNQARMVSL